MFKKFKDKLAEEMKQSPARLQASVQQLAQAVVSPALSNSSIQEVSASNDNFSLTEDGDETPKNTPVKHSFQNVDLMSPSPNRMEISRRSSVSSITSDASSLFPMYESPPNLYHLQSDMDQSASEMDDNISPHLDKVTKDQLYSAYKKVQTKYHKYRGRYTDLATHYRELDRVKSRLESVLVETQDKVLRRITDLKEQCQLEQQAKAHLEDVLRNDIEEKDHIINTLNTKIKLLQSSGPILDNSVLEEAQPKESSKGNLIDLANESSNDENNALSVENTQLKDKLKKLESLVLKYKESLKRNKEKFLDVMKEKNTLENDHEALKNSTAERISVTENELSAARIQIEKLTEQIDTLHKREEESAISLAENKLSVHRELEEKEEQIKQLRIDLKHVTEDKENLNETVARYKADLSELKSLHIDSDKNAIASKENIEAIKSMQQVGIKHHEEVDHSEKIKIEDENKLDEVTVRLKEKEIELQELQDKLDEMEKQTIEYKCDRESIQSELLAWKTTYSDLREEYQAHRIIAEERQKDADSTIEKLQATVQSVDKELENMRNALIDRDQVCENYNKKMQQYTDMLEEAKNKLTEQKAEIISLNDKLEKCSELQEELENKKTELKAIQNEFELCKSTIDDFKNKVQADSSVINLLKKERSDFINRLIYYNDCIHCLKQDYMVIKNVVAEEFLNQKAKILDMSASLATCFTKFEEENITLRSEIDELRSKIKDQEQLIVKETDLQSEFVRVANHKSALEAELRKSNERLKEMMLKSNQYDELNTTNNKLIAEIDNLNFKIHDLETTSHKLTQSQQEVKVLRERLRTLENLESVNHALSVEIDDLREKHAQASHAFKKVDELNAKLREATEVINSFKSENSNQDTLRKELYASRLEIAHLKEDLAEKEGEIKTRDEKLASEEEHVAHLKSTCDSHIQTIEEHVRKYLNLEAEYQATRENHAKETTELMENNKALQETINVKLVQLKKMKTIKERQNKTIEEVKAELDQSKTRQAELSKMLEIFKKQTESLKLENSQLVAITLENKDLKDQQNDLLNRNQTLCENDEVLKQKISDYEKEIEELRRTVKNYVESYKSQLNSQSEKAERLSNELNNVSAQLERKDAELNSLNERLMMSEKESQEIKGKLDERDVELKDKIFELGTVMTNGNVMKEENSRLCAELRTLKDEVKRIKDVEEKNKKLKSELNDLIQKNSGAEAIRSENNMLIAEQKTLKDRIAELERVKSSSMQLQTHVNNLQSKISSLEALRMENSRLQSEIEALQSAKSSSPEMGALKDTLTAKDAEIKLLEDKISNMSQEIGNLKRFSLEIDERRKGTDTLRNSLASAEEKITSLQSEINSLIRMNDALKKELETIRKDKDAKGQLISDTLREENKRLEAQLDEALITFQAKETQMQLANNELRSQTSQLREQLKTSEEEQGMRLKQLVKEFQAQLHDKEEELQAALEKRFDRQHNYESNLVQQYKEQLKDCQIELTEKSEQLESLVLEKKDVIAEKGKDIDRLVETIAQIKKEHTDEIKELEKKWKAIVQQKIDNLQVKHEDELNELTKEWQNERKELESTSRVAMAAIHTSTGSIHTLQQTLTSQRRELAELRKLVSLRHDTLEDSTEIEYLRNILFEYMMGRETMVLARVIAAVVKFDQEQTTKILKKEEDKLTLFGSLGLS
ncbi:PREDICTED: golgin subfamily A member 4-like isoform X2 [Trachymyrmex septentrionalis]|uniref:golgin subfamily A member 4-like isoform X2 n=1 Tax=Trachymyrmex septentrionalis TaxID=34720 RepID=UPI00084EDEC0|nr:PREDICTED: golgin subfamily A member 4-like isoform X2 [Trachymyrmex septentrionalis]